MALCILYCVRPSPWIHLTVTGVRTSIGFLNPEGVSGYVFCREIRLVTKFLSMYSGFYDNVNMKQWRS
jgi:hypothetical protein